LSNVKNHAGIRTLLGEEPLVESQLRMVLFRADGLAVGDHSLGTSDPYVKVVLCRQGHDDLLPETARDVETRNGGRGGNGGGSGNGRGGWGKLKRATKNRKVYKSPVKDATLDPRWDDKAKLVRGMDDTHLVVTVFDEDIGSVDEFLGQAVVPLAHIPANGDAVVLSLTLGDMTHCTKTGIPSDTLHEEWRRRYSDWYGDTKIVPSGTVTIGLASLAEQRCEDARVD
jgi:hypothetical protein